MGSQKRFNYSAMGDVVNVAARIESATKNFGVDLLVSEEVAQAARGIALLEAGEIMLKGKSRPTRLYAIVGGEGVAQSVEFVELTRLHRWLLQSIAAGDGEAAASALHACRDLCGPDLTGLYDHLAERVAASAKMHPAN
jgi:adenylate cyclase